MKMVELLNQSSFWYVLLTYLVHILKTIVVKHLNAKGMR